MPGVVKATGAEGEVRLDSGRHGRRPTSTASARASAATRWSGPRSSGSPPRASGSSGNLPSVEGLVESSLYLGTSTQMLVRLPDDVTLTVLCPNTDESERRSLPGAGSKVKLSWAPEHMHLVRESNRGGGSAADAEEQAQTA